MALTSDQVEAYLDRINLPQATRDALRGGLIHADADAALKALTTLQQCHMETVPFENLDVHYSESRLLPLETDLVYDRVVVRRRGGACPQVNLLFAKLIQFFGFPARLTGSRINAPASLSADPGLPKTMISYGPWVHVIIIVTIGSQRYIVDLTLSMYGAPFPMPLIHNTPVTEVWPRQRRMFHASIPGWAEDETIWRMQLRENDAEPWMDICCFAETEWLPADFHIMMGGLVQLRASWFIFRVACHRIILEDKIPVGYIVIWENELRRHYKGRTEIMQRFYCEADRVAALAEEFGIYLTDDEQKRIVGRSTELKDERFDFYGE